MRNLKPLLFLILFLFLASTSLVAQQNSRSKKPSELKLLREKALQDAKIFGNSDVEFENLETPKKWLDESAVVLARKIEYIYSNEFKNIMFEKIFRSRVTLLDQSAVELYSEFYFMSTNEIGIRIFKPDGTMHVVETDQAVEVENTVNVPSTFYSLKVEYKKLAVPNLEVGDIIDYYYHYKEAHINFAEHAFEPIIFTLSGDYPVLFQKIDFKVQFRGFYINFNSYNGADELIETENEQTRTKSFSFVDSDREKLESMRFLYKYLSEPTIKFQVVYSSPKYKRTSSNFLGEIGEPKSHVSQIELGEYVNRVTASNKKGVEYYVNTRCGYLRKKYSRNEVNKRRYLMDAYYYLRFYVLSSNGYDDLKYSVNDEYFVLIMKTLLDRQDIRNEIVVAIPRSTATLDNLLLSEELKWLLKVNIGNSEYIIFTPDRYSNMDDSYAVAEGCVAFAVIPSKNIKNMRVSEIEIPISSAVDNIVTKQYNVTLSDMNVMNIESTITSEGISKYDYFSSALIYDDYVPAEFRYFDFHEFPETKNATKVREQKRKINDRQAEDSKKREERFETRRNRSFNVSSFDDFELIETGIDRNSTSLVYSEKFSVEDLVKKAGPNYMLEIGMLIGSQIELEEKEMKRDKDIWIGHAVIYIHEINLTVPDGYKLQGIDKLNINVENETGGFISTAVLEGNVLKINTKKIYKNNYEPKENWSKMVEFIEAAYDFTQIKLLMKKV